MAEDGEKGMLVGEAGIEPLRDELAHNAAVHTAPMGLGATAVGDENHIMPMMSLMSAMW